MSISHAQAFELITRGISGQIKYGAGHLRLDRLEATVLAGLEPEQRRELGAHLAECPACTQDLALYGHLHEEAYQRWPAAAAPRRTAGELIQAVQTGRRLIHPPGRALGPLRVAFLLIVAAAAILILSLVLSIPTPQPAIHPPAATPTARSSPTPAASLPDIAKIPVQPLLPKGIYELGAWSPNDQYLTIFQRAPSSNPGSDRIFSTLTIYDAQTGKVCPAGEPVQGVQFGYGFTTWLIRDRLLAVSSKGVSIITPCSQQVEDITSLFADRILAVEPRGKWWDEVVLTGENSFWIYDPIAGKAARISGLAQNKPGNHHVSWAPFGREIAISQPDPTGTRISLVSLPEGKLLEEILVPLGTQQYPAGVDWLLENTLLAYSGSPDLGSILVERQPGVPARLTYTWKDIFKVDIKPPVEVMGEGAYGYLSEKAFHLILVTRSPQQRTIYLYHSDGGFVEPLPQGLETFMIFPDGETITLSLVFDAPSFNDRFQVIRVHDFDHPSREIIALGHQPRTNPSLSMDVSRGKEQIAFGSSQGVSLVSTIDGSLQGFWRLVGAESSDNIQLSLSSNGKNLAAEAMSSSGTAAGPESIIYMIKIGNP